MTTYYGNYATGSDTNSGTSPNSPWKHAPGDKNATGNVTNTTLVGGDEVMFAGGVVYQGSIQIPTGGTAGKPIVYEGTGYGTGQAIMSGLTSVTVNFTAVPGQPGVSVATLPTGLMPSLSNIVEIDGNVSYMSNNSTSTNPNAPDLGATSYKASEMTGSGSSWTFTDPTLAKTLSALTPSQISNLVFRTYVAGNNQLNMSVTGFNSQTGALSLSGAFVAPTGLPAGPSYTLYNDPNFVKTSDPYSEYAIEGNQLYAAVTPGTHTISVSTLPYAFETTKSNVTIDGFNISGYGAGDGRGVEVFNDQNIQITNNTFSNLATHVGYGYSAIYANAVTNLTVSGNTIGPNIANGAGIELLNDTNVVASRNTINGVGWTGIVAFGDSNTSISYNQISNLYYCHGAGIICYALSNGPPSQNVSITNNQIANAGTGIDFEGYNTSGPSAQPNNFTVADNVLTGITGWGIADYGDTNTANIYGNIVLTTPQAYGPFAVYPTSTNISYYDNIVSKYSYISPTLFTTTNTKFWGNVALAPYAGGAPPGTNTVNTALASVLTQALASPGSLPASIGSILSPGSSTPIGIDWTTAQAVSAAAHPGW